MESYTIKTLNKIDFKLISFLVYSCHAAINKKLVDALGLLNLYAIVCLTNLHHSEFNISFLFTSGEEIILTLLSSFEKDLSWEIITRNTHQTHFHSHCVINMNVSLSIYI